MASDSCFTREQVNFFVSQCYDAVAYKKSSINKTEENDSLKSVIVIKDKELASSKEGDKLELQKSKNETEDCEADKEILTKQNNKQRKTIFWYKVGSYVLVPLVVIESSYIGFLQLLKK